MSPFPAVVCDEADVSDADSGVVEVPLLLPGWQAVALETAARYSCAPSETLKGWRQKILTSEDPHGVHRSLQDAFDDFAWSAAA